MVDDAPPILPESPYRRDMIEMGRRCLPGRTAENMGQAMCFAQQLLIATEK
ncbi:hypothetical protein [Sphingobium yanoikuyae]|jgi:hypothetical protein|uniref:hypothetical protein n=1 Tax=Sphingobium yanoikuyae TaxID=13690 RepID=UPI00293C963E|nr:hypothetical protein [Sphingobium yanoikuyae]MDV3479214.1 hypothetical protein [Sphingobium yanoikuyae]